MKKLAVFFSLLLILISSFGYKPGNIDEQILRSFATNFPKAQKVTWQELQETYVVSFVEEDIRMRIIYLRNGKMSNFIRYYSEENLPLEIRLNIKKKFQDKRIHGVTEENIISGIDDHTKTVYHIKLEDSTSWLTIKADKNGKLKVIEKLNKD